MNNLDNWFNKTFSKVVAVGDRYGIRRRFLFKEEYLDLKSIVPDPIMQSKGSMYGTPNLVAPSKIQWWNRPDTIDRYALSEDLHLVLTAFEKLGCYAPPDQPVLPKAEAIKDLQMELAEYKLRK